MSDITVRVLGEADWQRYREVRLAALKDSPEAFVSTYEEEADYDEAHWRERMTNAQRLLAEVDGSPVGVVSLGDVDGDNPHLIQLFSLWVAPVARGTGVATALVQAGAQAALAGGHTHVAYWVGTDNGRAVAFASGFGFRPADSRRPMRVETEDGSQEIMMVLALGADRGQPTAF